MLAFWFAIGLFAIGFPLFFTQIARITESTPVRLLVFLAYVTLAIIVASSV